MKRPIVIWEESRLHSIVFSLRSISVALFAKLWPWQNNEWDHLALFICVMVHHYIADEITRRYNKGGVNGTTIRGKADGDKNSNEFAAPKAMKIATLMYSFYQFSAIGSVLMPNVRLMDLGFNILIAIQSATFIATLFRKGLVRWYTWTIGYSVALLASFIVIFKLTSGVWFWIKVATAFYIRVNTRIDKYKIWIVFSLLSLPVVENMLFAELEAYQASMQTSNFPFFKQAGILPNPTF